MENPPARKNRHNRQCRVVETQQGALHSRRDYRGLVLGNSMNKLHQHDSDVLEPTEDLVDQATQIGMRALLTLIREQRFTGGQGTLRVEVDGVVWEISAKQLLFRGPWVGGIMSWFLLLRCGSG